MKKYIEIEGDYNNGDYTKQTTLVSDEEIETLKPIIRKIKAHHGKVKFYVKAIDDEKLAIIQPYLPRFEGGDIHTIESIKIITVTNEEVLL